MLSRSLIAMMVLLFASTGVGRTQVKVDPSVPGFVPPAPGEHPRLFFRANEMPRLKERAATPEGKAIIARLRYQLNGGDGRSLPEKINTAGPKDPGELLGAPVGTTFTLFHGAGYGMLYRLTGEQIYANLGRTCVEMMLKGQGDRDGRYVFLAPAKGEFADAALAGIAMAYDLCYDGWADDFRQTVGNALWQHADTGTLGGEALALLAIRGDPGLKPPMGRNLALSTTQTKFKGFLTTMPDRGLRNVDPAKSIAVHDVAFIPALQAWRVAGGMDFVQAFPAAEWATLRLALWPVPGKSRVECPIPVRYRPDGGQALDRGGLAGGGQFSQGFGCVRPEHRSALLWIYEKFLVPRLAQEYPRSGVKDGVNDFDTVSPYPHRAVLALVNWPIGEKAKNPAEIFPRMVAGSKADWLVFRKNWNDENDLIVTALLPPLEEPDFATPTDPLVRMRIWGHGHRFVGNIGGNASSFATVANFNAKAKPIELEPNLWAFVFSAGTKAMIVDFRDKDLGQATVISQGFEMMPDFVDTPPAKAINVTGEWQCSPNLTMRLDQKGTTFATPVDNPWGRGKAVSGTIDGDRIVLQRPYGAMGARVAADANVIAWNDGSVWRRLGSPVAMIPAYKHQPGDRAKLTYVKNQTGKDSNANLAGLICVLTFDPSGNHPEVNLKEKNVVQVGEKIFDLRFGEKKK